MKLRKIGGIYWLSLGRLRLAFCIKARPIAKQLPEYPSEGYEDFYWKRY